MANYLKFDIYDLELIEVRSNLDLRSYLLETANRSILVVEDIYCSVEFADRNSDEPDSPKSRKEHQMTLSGLLNFIDGLWSSCTRRSSILHCTPPGFRVLASNYRTYDMRMVENKSDPKTDWGNKLLFLPAARNMSRNKL